jgi:hypothetical protein
MRENFRKYIALEVELLKWRSERRASITSPTRRTTTQTAGEPGPV